jgi:hypothetical protein
MASMHMPAQSAAAAELANAIYNTSVGDEADTLVGGIMDNVSPEVIVRGPCHKACCNMPYDKGL